MSRVLRWIRAGLRKILSRRRLLLVLVVELAGYGMLTAAAWLVDRRAGLAAGGAFLVLLAYASAGGKRR